MSDLSKHGHRISFNGFEISASALTTTEISWQLKAQFEMKWGGKTLDELFTANHCNTVSLI